jgi:hypothetical protein
MCRFLSAVYLKTGELICSPEFTDSHEELLMSYGIEERQTSAPVQHFVRLELIPPSTLEDSVLLDFSQWKEKVDEDESPEWFDAAARHDAFESMRDVLRIATNRTGRLLFGGLAFIRGQQVALRGVRAFALSGSKVTARSGSEVIAWSGSKVVAESGSEVTARSGSKVDAWSGSKVTARSGSKVVAESGSKVDAWSGSKVTAQPGSEVIARRDENT